MREVLQEAAAGKRFCKVVRQLESEALNVRTRGAAVERGDKCDKCVDSEHEDRGGEPEGE